FALTIGALVRRHPDPLAAWAATPLILGGSAQVAVLQLTAGGAALVAVATGLLIHARLVVYGLSLAPHWRHQPTWFRVVGAATLIDPTWALGLRAAREPGGPAARRAFHLGAALTLCTGWVAMVTVGAQLRPSLVAG